MARNNEDIFFPERLRELAARAEKTNQTVFTPFLTPPEAQMACAVARKQGVSVTLFGGYADAERQIAGFFSEEIPFGEFPITALEVAWPHQSKPTHQDLLGSLMALGIQRQTLGDIVILEGQAYLFIQNMMAEHVADSWLEAGRVKLQVLMAQALPQLAKSQGSEERFTVASLRLDAVVAGGMNLSRGKAAELIETGHVKLRYTPAMRSDTRVEYGDMISVRGKGRLQIVEIGTATRKGRIPITLTRFGIVKNK